MKMSTFIDERIACALNATELNTLVEGVSTWTPPVSTDADQVQVQVEVKWQFALDHRGDHHRAGARSASEGALQRRVSGRGIVRTSGRHDHICRRGRRKKTRRTRECAARMRSCEAGFGRTRTIRILWASPGRAATQGASSSHYFAMAIGRMA